MIDGVEIRDIKTKYSYPSDADYINSCQWRFLIYSYSMRMYFTLTYSSLKDTTKISTDMIVRGLPLKRYEPSITCYRYDGMEQDNMNLLHSFLEWAEYRNLTKYLLKEKIEE